MEETNETLCIGIDLGTSRSSISASNGERHVVDSYVGWPLDMVARKLVKKTVLVGREALDVGGDDRDLAEPLDGVDHPGAKLGIPAGSIGSRRIRCLDKLRRDPAIAALLDAHAAAARGKLSRQAAAQR